METGFLMIFLMGSRHNSVKYLRHHAAPGLRAANSRKFTYWQRLGYAFLWSIRRLNAAGASYNSVKRRESRRSGAAAARVALPVAQLGSSVVP